MYRRSRSAGRRLVADKACGESVGWAIVTATAVDCGDDYAMATAGRAVGVALGR
ncbi:MAG: hypothetical protein AB1505_13580 [Candidatus Latescibacterota bacterium]